MASPFFLRKDSKAWFRNVEGSFDSSAPMFELFYLCALAGLAAMRPAEYVQGESHELVDHFPGEFASRYRLIVGLFLVREIKRLGISLHEKASLRKTLADFLDPRSLSQLSDAGVKQLNRYASGGFEQLCEWFTERPTDIETFLPSLCSKVRAAIGPQPQEAS